MEIVGGLYHELCDFPRWRAIRGSGGRAAFLLAGQVAARLHCYASARESAGIEELQARGVTVCAHSAPSGIAFAYFHSLSTPHIEPPPETLRPAEPFTVSGQTFLRFGLLEGDPVIKAAGRAVYDPQTAREPIPFHANGSSASEWALVVNARELAAIGGSEDLAAAAARAQADQGAAVVVAKCGPAGAQVFVRDTTRPVTVPAYQSDRVFKIGTGDVFSAAFAFHWAERGLPADLAADRASRAVSAYCDHPHAGLLEHDKVERPPVPTGPGRTILLLGASETLGQRYVLEEARFRLRELGAEVVAPALDLAPPACAAKAVLVVADGAGQAEWACADALAEGGARRIVFAQPGDGVPPRAERGAIVTNDFATAVYRAIWASYKAVE